MGKLTLETTIGEWHVKNIEGGIVNVGQSHLSRVSRHGGDVEQGKALRRKKGRSGKEGSPRG